MAATRYIAAGSTTLGTVTIGDDIKVLGGSAEIATNTDQSSLTDILSVEVPASFNGSFGTVTAPFKAQVTSFFEYAATGGNAYFVSEDDTGAETSAKLIMPKGTGGHFHFNEMGMITSAEIASGSFTVAAACVVTNLYCGQGATVRLFDSASTDPTLVQMAGGNLYLDRGATTLTVSQGSNCWIQGVNVNAIGTLNCLGGNVWLIESGTITTANVWNGPVPNCSRLGRPLTISNTNINMSLPGAEDFLNHPLITHSSVTKYMGR